ncbi:ATP-binding cassette domain-containing protein [Bifidobacterium sp. 82T24]|uniref:ATP-binding cassette domain-containing protein n=1 Tax=Bifidobacterium pluvialisilvae TaxID=2834436 RepID=UPI001C585986|nr:ATP-binding cassette domain-containing protein [Bifidobacterium pluvialisilvae]MBW3087429.1 ATP-binding cassette domain-containing protein [Bifidobacterium pluvialisilvae]
MSDRNTEKMTEDSIDDELVENADKTVTENADDAANGAGNGERRADTDTQAEAGSAAEKSFPKFDIVFDDAVETVTIDDAGNATTAETTDEADDKADDDAAGNAVVTDADDDADNDTDADVDADTTEESDDGTKPEGEGTATEGENMTSDGNDDADVETVAAQVAAEGIAAAVATTATVTSSASASRPEPVEAEHAAAHIDREIDTDDAFKFRSYPALALKHASYAPDRKGGDVLHDVDMEFHARRFYSVWAQSEAERVAVVGLLSGLMAPTDGKVMFKSQELHELTPLEYRGHFMGLIPQRYALREDLSAVQNLVLTMEASGRNFLKAKPILAAEQLEAVGFPDAKNDRPVHDLLEVEKRKAAIARALVCEANVILADDPTGQLGDEARQEIMTLLRRLTRRDDHCVILVTEDKETAESADIMYRL